MEPFDPDNPSIYIDHRERSGGLADALRTFDIFEIKERTLEECDLQIQDVGFERKTGEDLVNSLQDGRLFRQLTIMRRVFRRRILIVEGDVSPSRLPLNGQDGLWCRISIGLQTPILRSRSVEHTARIVFRCALQIFGFTYPHAATGAKTKGADPGFYQRLALVSLPGIGLARARSLLAHFGSLKGVLSASQSDLLAVQGIGQHHAEVLTSIAGFSGRPDTTNR
jgi:Fanconi anemia group M protein